MRLFSVVLFTTITLLTIITTFSQKIPEKPYTKWKKGECISILQDSAWVRQFADIDITMWSKYLNDRSESYPVSPVILIRLSSSLTVQQALYRLKQIEVNYDSMPQAEKDAFDLKNRDALACSDCKKFYIVTVMQPAHPRARATLVGQRFKDLKLADLSGNIYLTNENGERREIVNYFAPTTENGIAVFYFERFDEKGQPLFKETSKKLMLVQKLRKFDERAAGVLDPKSEFNVSKITVNGMVDF